MLIADKKREMWLLLWLKSKGGYPELFFLQKMLSIILMLAGISIIIILFVVCFSKAIKNKGNGKNIKQDTKNPTNNDNKVGF